MTTCFVAFAIALAVACGATVAVREIARRTNVVDRPDGFRKLHHRDVPLLGGIALYVAFGVPLAALFFLYRNAVSDLLRQHPAQLLALTASATVALAMGVLDDVLGLPVRWKLILQVAAATVAFCGGFSIEAVSNPFGEPWVLGMLSYPVTLFWLMGCMNAVNLLDGLDGLAAGVCLFATLTLFLVSLFFGNVMSMLLMASLGGAILGFLLFNFYPASIFLGDSGSMLLGFLIGALALLGVRKTEAAIALLIPVILLGLPILDTMLAILRRWCKKLPISAADRQHLHHVLMGMGLTHRQAVLILYAACVALCGAALLVTAGRNEVTILVLGSLGTMAFVCTRVFGHLRFADVVGRVTDELEHNRRSRRARMSVEVAVTRMETARDAEALWDAVSGALDGLGLDRASLRLNGDSGLRPCTLTWSNNGHGGHDGQRLPLDSWSARLRVQTNGYFFGELELRKLVGSGTLLAETPELAERLRTELASQIERLRSCRRELAAERWPVAS